MQRISTVDHSKLVHWPNHAHAHTRQTIEQTETYQEAFRAILDKLPAKDAKKALFAGLVAAAKAKYGYRFIMAQVEKYIVRMLVLDPWITPGAHRCYSCSAAIFSIRRKNHELLIVGPIFQVADHAVARILERKTDASIEHAFAELRPAIDEIVLRNSTGRPVLNDEKLKTPNGVAVIESEGEDKPPVIITWYPRGDCRSQGGGAQ